MAEFNPFGQLLQSRMASDQFGLQKSQNAMQQQRQDRQMQMQDRQIQQLDQSQQMEFAKTLGPIAAEMAQHPPELQAEQWSKLQPVLNKFMPQALEGMGAEFTPQVQQAIAGLAQFHNSTLKPKDEGTQTDIWRYAGLAERQWEAEHPGVPMPAKEKMAAMMAIKRAQPQEAGAVAGAKAAVQLKTAEELAASKERGKLAQQLKLKPAIQAAVKLAEEAAKAKGETLTTLARAEAALPGLMETVGTLKELAPIATSTFGGKVFDIAVKESGFGSTKGATARAKFIAIVMNQVLPLLKPTFGAAFTVEEGKELKATMGDPDSSPAEKIAQLEAFIAQKRRSIETAQREVSNVPPSPQAAPTQQVIKFDAQGNMIQ